MTLAQRLHKLLSHSERCHGEFPEPTVQDPKTGKWNCSGETVTRNGKTFFKYPQPGPKPNLAGLKSGKRLPLTVQMVEKHLTGAWPSYGIQFVAGGNTSTVGAIDLDVYQNLDRAKFVKIVRDQNLPLMMTASKSGGLYFWYFSAEPLPAVTMLKLMRVFRDKLGLPGKTECNPKKPWLAEPGESKSQGNWCNLPFHPNKLVDLEGRPLTRLGINEKGEAIVELEQWLDAAEAMQARCTKEWALKFIAESPEPLGDDLNQDETKHFVMPDKVGNGQWDDMFFRYACQLRAKGFSLDEAKADMFLTAERVNDSGVPVDKKWLDDKAESVFSNANYAPKKKTPAFDNREDGLFGDYFNPNTKEMEIVRIGAQLTGIERARDGQDEGWSVVVEFKTDENKPKQVLLTAKDFHSTGRATQQKLSEAGYHPPLGHQVVENRLLLIYLDTMKDLPFSRRTGRPGWDSERHTFTTSREVIGSTERLRYEGPDLYKQAGSFEMWRQEVADQLTGNSVGVFEMSAAFTSPVLPWLDLDGNPAFLIVGDSSLGKTKCHECAASVWGDPNCEHGDSYLQLCKTTSNGLEALFERVNDTGAIFDDLKQLTDDDVEHLIFTAATGKGKQRLNVEAKDRKTRTWSGITLISCEITSATKAAEGYKGKGKVVHAGSEVRMPNIVVKEIIKNGQKQGLFEEIWGSRNSLEFVEKLSTSARANFGHAGPMFIRAFMADRDESIKIARETLEYVNGYILDMLPKGNRQAGRVAGKFAAVAAGGELATRYGLTGWPAGEAEGAAIQCFDMWFQNWPGSERGFGSSQIVEHAKRMIQRESASFEGEWEQWRDGQGNFHYRDPKIRNRLGWRIDNIYFMEPATFTDYFKAFGNRNEVAAVLHQAGMLVSGKPAPKRAFQTYRKPLAENQADRRWGYALVLPVDEPGPEEVAVPVGHQEVPI